jgi:protein-L-isoaspartate(D-aspartate) O-methyltransferase
MPGLDTAKKRMLDHIRATVRDERVLDALSRVPREAFVSPDLADHAYDDNPLPIGEGQTISQPLIVAMMTEALGLAGGERVLEVGTGSGYQAAVLSHLAGEVTTVERFPQLVETARGRLAGLGLNNVKVQVSPDGPPGWPEGAPYDAVIVTAAAPYVAQSLLDQVKDGGRIVIPVGTRDQQDLLVITRCGEGISRRSLGGCRFVPLIGSQAWPSEG